MLQPIGRAATPKDSPRNCLNYLQTLPSILIMRVGGCYQNLCEVCSFELNIELSIVRKCCKLLGVVLKLMASGDSMY